MKTFIVLSLLAFGVIGYVSMNHEHNHDHAAEKKVAKLDYYYSKSGDHYCRGIKRGWLFDCQSKPYDEKPEETAYDDTLPHNSYYN